MSRYQAITDIEDNAVDSVNDEAISLDVAGSRGYFVTSEILEKNGISEHKTSLGNKSKH